MKKVICFLISFVLLIVGSSIVSNYLDERFYGKGWKENRLAYANEARAGEIQDDSEWHYQHWMKRKEELNYRVIFTFPDYDKKTTKLVVVHDKVNDMFCYVLENRPYNFKTGLNCFPGWYIRRQK